MFGSFRIARIFGIDLRIQWITIFFPLFFFMLSQDKGWLVLAAMISVIPHEYGHSLTAKWLGNQVGDILITPLGGMAQVGLQPFEHKKELLIVFAGPLVNLVIALSSLGLILLIGNPKIQIVFMYILQANIVLALFNLLPIFPMDGGRILRATLGLIFGEPTATKHAYSVSLGMCVFFGVFGLVTLNIFLVFVMVFIYMMSLAEYKMILQVVKERSNQEK